MFRRMIVLSVLVLSFVGFSFAVEIDKTLFTHTTEYNLKNLNNDLKKNFDVIQAQKNCDQMRCGDFYPNYYQLKETNDVKVRQFIIALKLKNYQRATNLFNN